MSTDRHRSVVQYTVDSPCTHIWIETGHESGHLISEFSEITSSQHFLWSHGCHTYQRSRGLRGWQVRCPPRIETWCGFTCFEFCVDTFYNLRIGDQCSCASVSSECRATWLYSYAGTLAFSRLGGVARPSQTLRIAGSIANESFAAGRFRLLRDRAVVRFLLHEGYTDEKCFF